MEVIPAEGSSGLALPSKISPNIYPYVRHSPSKRFFAVAVGESGPPRAKKLTAYVAGRGWSKYHTAMNLGMPEMIFIFLLALILFGPKRLPQIGRELGKALNEFRRASNEFKSQLENELQQVEAADRAQAAAKPAPEASPTTSEAAHAPTEPPEPRILPPSEPTVASTLGQPAEAEPHQPELPGIDDPLPQQANYGTGDSDPNRNTSKVAVRDERSGADHYNPLRESNA